jgi:hypothetical protein
VPAGGSKDPPYIAMAPEILSGERGIDAVANL